MRVLLWLFGAVLLGLLIHLAVILTLPTLAADTLWSRLAAPLPLNTVSVLPPVKAGAPNPFALDPLLSYAVCRVDLHNSPAIISGTLPDTPWSLAVISPAGTVMYSTTNSEGVSKNLDVGIFNADETHLLAEQKIDVADGLLIVEADADDLLVVIRLEPAQQAVRARYEQMLGKLSCTNMPAS